MSDQDWFKIDGNWHHCAIVIADGKAKHYMDGEYSHTTDSDKSTYMYFTNTKTE